MDSGMQLWCLEINEQFVKWVIRDRDTVKGVRPDVCRNAVTLLQDITKSKEKEAKALPRGTLAAQRGPKETEAQKEVPRGTPNNGSSHTRDDEQRRTINCSQQQAWMPRCSI